MKCLSIRPPWAQMIVGILPIYSASTPIKDVENRSWATAYRGPLLIHSSKTCDREAAEWYGIPRELLDNPSVCARGAVIGRVELVDCRLYGERRFAEEEKDNDSFEESEWHMEGQYGFYLRDPVGFTDFFPRRGMLKLFDVPLDEVRHCRHCGCTDQDCSECIQRAGEPCHWVEDDLCSSCKSEIEWLEKENQEDKT